MRPDQWYAAWEQGDDEVLAPLRPFCEGWINGDDTRFLVACAHYDLIHQLLDRQGTPGGITWSDLCRWLRHTSDTRRDIVEDAGGDPASILINGWTGGARTLGVRTPAVLCPHQIGFYGMHHLMVAPTDRNALSGLLATHPWQWDSEHYHQVATILDWPLHAVEFIASICDGDRPAPFA